MVNCRRGEGRGRSRGKGRRQDVGVIRYEDYGGRGKNRWKGLKKGEGGKPGEAPGEGKRLGDVQKGEKHGACYGRRVRKAEGVGVARVWRKGQRRARQGGESGGGKTSCEIRGWEGRGVRGREGGRMSK